MLPFLAHRQGPANAMTVIRLVLKVAVRESIPVVIEYG
jgi:hypothetical protein